ncbi:MAG: class I SAM-dependent methyltransferase [Halioglobus sp.]
MIKRSYDLLRRLVPGVSWKHPLIAFGLRLLDPIDSFVRATRGLSTQPRLSLRVRSNGLRGQFGGQKFYNLGQLFATELVRLADVCPDSKVLEIGCGVGRNAFGLASVLKHGGFTGVDIDKTSIDGVAGTNLSRDHGFRFEFIDVRNPEYNPDGVFEASDYRFCFEDSTFDVVFLVSVVTHILPPDFEHYVSEIARMLRPGGRIAFTTFLMNEGVEFDGRLFSYGEGPWRSTNAEIPEICVGYHLDYLCEVLASNGFDVAAKPVLSEKRGSLPNRPTTPLGQDLIIAVKLA